MANIIGRNPQSCSRECLQMSNGLTDVFVNVLVLSGSALAKTVSEKRLIVWLAEKDQSRVGAGTVDFDLWEMPWDSNTFEEDRGFWGQRSGWAGKSWTTAPMRTCCFPAWTTFRS